MTAPLVKIFGEETAPGLFELVRLRKIATKALDPLGFTMYEAVLLLLVAQGKVSPIELIAVLGIQRTAVSSLITKLVNQGLVIRSANARDGRSVCIQLTGRGRVAVERINEAWIEHAEKG